MRDPRTDPQPGDRLRRDGVLVEVTRRYTQGGCPAVSYLVGGFLPWLLLDAWRKYAASAVVEHVAGGSDV